MANVVADKKALVEGERPIFQASYGKLMMWFFLVSDAFTFSALLIGYGALRMSAVSEGASWAYPEQTFTHTPFLYEIWHIEAPLVFVGIMTFILILSSVTMVLAVEAGHRKSRKEVSKWVALTIVGGVAFLSCQAYEWYHFISGTEHGGMMIDLTEFQEHMDPAGQQVPNLESLAVLELHPVEDENGEISGFTYQDRNPVPGGAAKAAEILEVGSHTHAETYILTPDEAKALSIPYEDSLGVKAFDVLSSDSIPMGIRLTNGYEIQNPAFAKLMYEKWQDDSEQTLRVTKTQGGSGLVANEYGPPDFAGLFFFVTGFHGTHVFSGVVLLLILLINVNKGTYDRRGHYEMTEKIGLYWHFVDLVWVFVFTFFYLV